MNLKDEFLKICIGEYAHAAGQQNGDGQILVKGGIFTTYSQFLGYYFAYLFKYKNAGNPYCGDPAALDAAVRAWDFYCTLTNENGVTKLYTKNQYWCDFCDKWGIYYWMETIELIREDIPDEKLAAWLNRLRAMVDRLREYIDEHVNEAGHPEKLKGNTENLFVWAVVCYYRYGMLYGRPDFAAYSEKIMSDILSAQTVAGCWLEGGTPVVNYADITFTAVSLYEHYSGSAAARDAVRKGLGYALETVYPDFTKNDCIDGRNHYRDRPFAYTAPTFFRHRGGTAYLSGWLSMMARTRAEFQNDYFALTVFTHIASILPGTVPFMPEDISAYQSADVDFPELKLKIRRRGDWIVTLCCLEQSTFDNRWILDRQNLYSVYHRKAGLIVGGGHSVAQPQFSCFNVAAGGCMRYLHDQGEALDGFAGMSLAYGHARCGIRFLSYSEREIEIEYVVEGLSDVDRVAVNIPLACRAGDAITACGGLHALEHPLSLGIEGSSPFSLKGCGMSLSRDAVFLYPVFPFNPYVRKQTADYGSAAGVVTVELDWQRPGCLFVIKAPDPPSQEGA